MEEIFRTNGNQKKAAVAILVSGKAEFKTHPITNDKEGSYLKIKGSV